MSEALTKAKRDELRALLERATPGPWLHYEERDARWDDPKACGYDRHPLPTSAFDYHCTGPRAIDGEHASRDAAFIAAARNNLGALLDQLDDAGAKLEAIGELLSANGCDCDCDCDGTHDDDCSPCFACRVNSVLEAKP